MIELIEYIERLQNESFEGWTPEQIQGYKTALISVLDKAEKIMDKKKANDVLVINFPII